MLKFHEKFYYHHILILKLVSSWPCIPITYSISSVQLRGSSCPTLWDPMDWSMPGLSVHHKLLAFTQNSCPLSWWCPLTISSSVIHYSSHVQSFPELGSFQISQLLAPGGQSIGVSASVSVLPMNIQDWFPLGWTGCISLHPSDSLESLPTPQFKNINSLVLSFFFFFYSPTLTSIHDHWKNHSLD